MQKNLEQTLEREPTSEEISNLIPDLTAEKITECLQHATNIENQISLDGADQYTNDNGNRPLSETIQKRHSPQIHYVEKQISKKELPNFFPILSQQDQKIVELFLIQELPYEDIAKIVNLTPKKVEKQYRSAIKKLKEFIQTHNLSTTTSLSDLPEIYSSSFVLE